MGIQTIFFILSESTLAIKAIISVIFGMLGIQTVLSILFGIVVLLFLVIDLGFFNRTCHKMEFKSALYQSVFWVAISLTFAVLIYLYMDKESAVLFVTAYVTEKMLSVDNLFVLILIFNFFALEAKYHHRVLFYGIMGALVFRGIFIGAGALLISQFYWVLYIFGAFLVYSGIKLVQEKNEEDENFEEKWIVKFARRFLPFSANNHEGRFFVKENGKVLFTSLFLIVLLVEATDIIFAVDSIPAVFAISQDPFIVFTSNIFAVLGMRSLFFVVEGFMERFHHLNKALCFILVFIGIKMLVVIFGIHIPSLLSFGIIMSALVIAFITSICFPKK
ncbi:MAG: TerC/Alx family metal homeostasis membrane protein [Candidatus Parcubacteria bacterium]|nr:TerC/Alx family metal homeostasis membrane protein [Candidatus Parcubacteria bacterium]